MTKRAAAPAKEATTAPRQGSGSRPPLTDLEVRLADLDRKLRLTAVDLRSIQREMKAHARRLAAANNSLFRRRRELERKVHLKEGQLSEKVKRLSILYEVGQALSTTLERDEVLALIVRLTARHLKARKASLMLVDPGSKTMKINSAKGIRRWIVERTVIKVGEGIAGRVAAEGEPVLIADISTDARFGRPSRGTYRTGSFLSVPLKRQEKVLGVLNVSDKRSQEPFDQDDFHLVTTLASEAAIAVENATLYQHLKERMATLEELYRMRESERRQLLTLINSITDGIVAVDPAGRPLFVNARAQSQLALDASPPEGARLADLLPAGELSRSLLEGMDAALTTAVSRREISVPAGEGENRHLELISLPVRERTGDLIGALTVLRDVTAFKELDQTKSDFLNRASHQLKTPVGLIRGFADTLVKHPDIEEEQRRHFLGLIHQEASRLTDLIENLLDFAQVESKMIRVEMERVSLEAFLRETLPAFEARAAERGIRIDLAAQGAPVIETDPNCLREAVGNILDNSLKFTPRDGTISITVERRDREADLFIRDSGPGIAENELPRIFDKFYTGMTTNQGTGTGLGLYIAKELIDTLGGGISVSSRLGEGTSFRITLPVERGKVKTPGEPSGAGLPGPRPDSKD